MHIWQSMLDDTFSIWNHVTCNAKSQWLRQIYNLINGSITYSQPWSIRSSPPIKSLNKTKEKKKKKALRSLGQIKPWRKKMRDSKQSSQICSQRPKFKMRLKSTSQWFTRDLFYSHLLPRLFTRQMIVSAHNQKIE